MEVLGLLGLLLLSVVILGILMEAGDKKLAGRIDTLGQIINLNRGLEDDRAMDQYSNSNANKQAIEALQKKLNTVTEQLNSVSLAMLEQQKPTYTYTVSSTPKKATKKAKLTKKTKK